MNQYCTKYFGKCPPPLPPPATHTPFPSKPFPALKEKANFLFWVAE